MAWELGLSRATTYRMIRLFRAAGTVTSLMDRTRGRRHGFRVLDTAREEIIRQTITSFYLKPTRPPFSRLCRQVQVRRRPKTGELGWAFYWRGLFAGFQSPGLKVYSR